MTSQRNGHQHDPSQETDHLVLAWRGGTAAAPRKLWFTEPADALATAVVYLSKGYCVRLGDGLVGYLGTHDLGVLGTVEARAQAGALRGGGRAAAS